MISRNSTTRDSNNIMVKILTTTWVNDVWEHYDLCQMSSGEEKAHCKKKTCLWANPTIVSSKLMKINLF